jgi:hypothetical protein
MSNDPDGWQLSPEGPPAAARRCADGLVHFIYYDKTRGLSEPGTWLRVCDCNDDFVEVKSLPMRRGDVTCVACVALESKGTLRLREE